MYFIGMDFGCTDTFVIAVYEAHMRSLADSTGAGFVGFGARDTKGEGVRLCKKAHPPINRACLETPDVALWMRGR